MDPSLFRSHWMTRGWWRQRGPVFKGILGGILGVLGTLLLIHLVSLYLSLLQIIQFVNTYGPRIQQLK